MQDKKQKNVANSSSVRVDVYFILIPKISIIKTDRNLDNMLRRLKRQSKDWRFFWSENKLKTNVE